MGWRHALGQFLQRMIELFLVVLAVINFAKAVSQLFHIGLDVRKFSILVILWSAGILLASLVKKLRWWIYGLLLLAWGFYLLKEWKQIEAQRNLVPILFLCVLIIGISIYQYHSSLVLIALSVFLVAAMLLLDLYPQKEVLFFWFAILFSVRAIGKNGADGITITVFVTTYLLLAVLHQWVMPPVAEKIAQHNGTLRDYQAKINERLENFSDLFVWKTEINGKLDNEDPGDDTGVDLVVFVDHLPKKNIYLRGFIGDDYTGNGWSEISDEEFFRETSLWNQEYMDYGMIQTQLINAYYNKRDAYEAFLSENRGSETMVVRYEKYNGKYELVPYGCKLNRQDNFSGDGILLSSGAEEHHYPFYDIEETLNISDGSMGSFSPITIWYEEYAGRQYLDGFENLDGLKAVCNSFEGEGFFEARDFIKDYLSQNCTYNKKLETLPYGADFTEYFLFTQKQGYCAHFATAATLMFRKLGFPARYVSGYVVHPESFERSENRYQAQVTGNCAHAWVEVLFDGIWYPVEVTPGYLETSISYEEQTQETIGEEVATQEDETKTAIQENTEDEMGYDEMPSDEDEENGAAEEEKTDGSIQSGKKVLFPLKFMGILVLLMVFILLRRRAMRWWFKRTVRQGKKRKAVLKTGTRILTMAEAAGYKKGQLSDLEFAQILPHKDAGRAIEIAQKARYSPDSINSKEVRICEGVCRELEKQFYSQLSVFGKILWKYFYCYR